MLRVGLTGGLGSGKSTVAAILRSLGAYVIEADALGREMMEPGQPIYSEILRVFGLQVRSPDGKLNRPLLAELAFAGGRLHQLNGIIHPAVVAAQQRWMDDIFARDPKAVAVVESALIFEVVRDARLRGETGGILADWHRRMDRVILVTAPDNIKIARYAARVAPAGIASGQARADARNRLAHQIPDAQKAPQADYVIDNSGSPADLRAQVDALWKKLEAESNKLASSRSLQ